MDKRASLSITAMVLGSVEFFTEFGLVILRYIIALLEFMSTVSKRALEIKNSKILVNHQKSINQNSDTKFSLK